MKHVRRINPSEYNEVLNDGKEDFLRDELNLARKLDAFNTGTDILEFSLSAVETGPAVIDADAHTVTLEVADGTGLTALEPVVKVSEGATVDPESAEEVDFTSAVTYTVTAADGTEQEWEVTITEAAE
jgi:hypothetical protein